MIATGPSISANFIFLISSTNPEVLDSKDSEIEQILSQSSMDFPGNESHPQSAVCVSTNHVRFSSGEASVSHRLGVLRIVGMCGLVKRL